jgi:hypothetical protein
MSQADGTSEPDRARYTFPFWIICDLSILRVACYGYVMSKGSGLPSEFWHVRHACGHAIYWSDPIVAIQTSAAACPWCGAEVGKKVPKNVLMFHDPNAGLVAFREKTPDGCVPWPRELSDVPDSVIVRHMADGSCCNN